MLKKRVSSQVLFHQPDPRSKRLRANGAITFLEAKDYAVIRSDDSRLVLGLDEKIPETRLKKLNAKLAKKVVIDHFKDIPNEHKALAGKICKCFGCHDDPWYEEEGGEGTPCLRVVVSKVWREEMEAFGGESGEIEPFENRLQLVFPVVATPSPPQPRESVIL
jgi:hypothetical protein